MTEYNIPPRYPLQLSVLDGLKSHSYCVMFSVLYQAFKVDKEPYLNTMQLVPAVPTPVQQAEVCRGLQALGLIKDLKIDETDNWYFSCKIAYKPDRNKTHLVARDTFKTNLDIFNDMALKQEMAAKLRRVVYDYLLDRNGFLNLPTIMETRVDGRRDIIDNHLNQSGEYKQLELGTHTYYVKPDQPIGEQYVREERKAILDAGGTKIMRISKITDIAPKVILRCLYDLYGDWAAFE